MPKSNMITLDQKSLKKAMQTVLKDKDFRNKLARKPVEALESIGIKLPDEVKEKSAKKSLADLLQRVNSEKEKYLYNIIPLPTDKALGWEETGNMVPRTLVLAQAAVSAVDFPENAAEELKKTVDALNLVTNAEEQLNKTLVAVEKKVQTAQKKKLRTK